MAINSVAQWGGGVGRARFSGTDLPDELPEAVMNGPADGLMTDKEKKPTGAGNSWKTTHWRDNYKCRVTAVKVMEFWNPPFLEDHLGIQVILGGGKNLANFQIYSLPWDWGEKTNLWCSSFNVIILYLEWKR